jgi:hypothetical protein
MRTMKAYLPPLARSAFGGGADILGLGLDSACDPNRT